MEFLIPLALKELEKDLFVETEFFEGDLFRALVQINAYPHFWASHPHEKRTLIALYNQQRGRLDTFEWPERLRSELKYDFDKFAQSGAD
ncbi:contact-dependent growth inhibition system immunity protein [Hymenobacter arizonensis]|uniref:contact-dependent growth inhibition system immunity protein n=1 Tax=Hymenobacter arizonensis TaxID=1227077 RepID=UPI000B82E345